MKWESFTKKNIYFFLPIVPYVQYVYVFFSRELRGGKGGDGVCVCVCCVCVSNAFCRNKREGGLIYVFFTGWKVYLFFVHVSLLGLFHTCENCVCVSALTFHSSGLIIAHTLHTPLLSPHIF